MELTIGLIILNILICAFGYMVSKVEVAPDSKKSEQK